jgi:hypothetical protein
MKTIEIKLYKFDELSEAINKQQSRKKETADITCI